MYDHTPIEIDEFNGIWQRKDSTESCPLDHFTDAANLEFIEGGIQTRAGITVWSGGIGFFNILKVKNYQKVVSESLLLLDSGGNIYDTGSPTPSTPILTIVGMLDFGLTIFAGRAYISPSTKVHGMAGEFVYVYKGDGVVARKAAGIGPIDAEGVMVASAGAAGHVQAGYHIFGIVYETDTGFFTKIGPDTLAAINVSGTTKVDLTSIPVPTSAAVIAKHIVVTKFIPVSLYTGDTRGYEFFFLPGGELTVGDTAETVDFYDVELLDSADYLLDILSEIPAGVGLSQYKGRMLDWTQEPDDEQSNILVSIAGEPEVFDAITGLIQLDANNQPITICQELRDILYIFKYAQTFATQDNGEEPANWGSPTKLDQGFGAALHGIALSLDQGGVAADFLMVANYSGIMMFNGTFAFPEFSWKIAKLWGDLEPSDFQNIEFYNDTILKRLYCILPDLQTLLVGDYQRGLDMMKVRWIPWTANVEITSICLTNINQLIIASNQTI